eukprot:5705001-Pleurochrysis_carterae.AAC.1
MGVHVHMKRVAIWKWRAHSYAAEDERDRAGTTAALRLTFGRFCKCVDALKRRSQAEQIRGRLAICACAERMALAGFRTWRRRVPECLRGAVYRLNEAADSGMTRAASAAGASSQLRRRALSRTFQRLVEMAAHASLVASARISICIERVRSRFFEWRFFSLRGKRLRLFREAIGARRDASAQSRALRLLSLCT